MFLHPTNYRQFMNSIIYRSAVLKLLIVTIGTILFPAEPAHGCFSSRIASIHFTDLKPDFGTPIRKTSTGWWDTGLWTHGRFSEQTTEVDKLSGRRYIAAESARTETTYEQSESMDSAKLLNTKLVTSLYDSAFKKETSGQWTAAEALFKRIEKIQSKRDGELQDHFQFLYAIRKHGKLTADESAAIKDYLTAIRHGFYPTGGKSKLQLQSLLGSTKAKFLRDRISYKLATIDAVNNSHPEAIAGFSKLINQYPHSPIKEQALIMLARTTLLPSSPSTANVLIGQSALNKLRTEYPHSRFSRSDFGLRARIHYLRHQYNNAIWCYYKLGDLASVGIICDELKGAEARRQEVRLMEEYLLQLARRKMPNDELDVIGVRQIRGLRSRFDMASVKTFSTDLSTRHELLAEYIYYRLYYTNMADRDLASLATMANHAVAANTSFKLRPEVCTRLAEIEYQLHHYSVAISWANRAIHANSIDRAYFLRAASLQKQGQLSGAYRDLKTVLKLSAVPELILSARQLLAINCEKQGKYGEALDQFFALGYSVDAAYVADILMSTEELKSYLKIEKSRRPLTSIAYDKTGLTGTRTGSYSRVNMLQYTIGVQYLRSGDFRGARKWLTLIPSKVRYEFDRGRREFESDASPNALDAANNLIKLQTACKSMRGYEHRAKAAYAFASYYHTHGRLLLYNPMLWQGNRVVSFEFYWNPDVETKYGSVVRHKYLATDDVFIRSKELCLEVAKKFPSSSVAPQALYRAACATSRIGVLAVPRTDDDGKKSNQTEFQVPSASALMRRVVAEYPHSSLVAAARKYAIVFAKLTNPRTLPHFAKLNSVSGPRRNLQIANTSALEQTVLEAEVELPPTPKPLLALAAH